MKNPTLRQSILFTFCLLTFDFLLFAQAPQGIPYQAIARNASGAAISNTSVKVRFSIRDSIATGAIKYQETHNPTTSALGLFSVNVGMGTAASGTFSGINWGKNSKFLQVEMNTTGGTSYTDLGTTQMMSVPYALFSGNSSVRVSEIGDSVVFSNGSFFIFPGASSRNSNKPYTVFDSDRNGYHTVKIGTQTWLQENLRTKKYSNGEIIVNSGDNFAKNFLIPNGPNSVSDKLGYLYKGYIITDSRGLCPVGYHIPSQSEWVDLINYIGINSADKVKGVNFWPFPDFSSTNSSGFSALPVGPFYYSGYFSTISEFGKQTQWWSTSFAYFDQYYNYKTYGLSSGNSEFQESVGGTPSAFPIRCIKD
jgi:uncharacterized protein (TIGR02145 family)